MDSKTVALLESIREGLTERMFQGERPAAVAAAMARAVQGYAGARGKIPTLRQIAMEIANHSYWSGQKAALKQVHKASSAMKKVVAIMDKLRETE